MKNDQRSDRQNIGEKSEDKSVFAKVKITQTITSTSISKGSKSSTTEVRSHTRISSRRFTGANETIELQPFDLTGMNSAGVVSAGGLGGPHAYLDAVAKLQKSGVLGFNDINILPTDDNRAQWITDANTLIEDFNAWAMQNNVDTKCEESAPGQRDPGSQQAVAVDAFDNHSTEQQVGHGSANDRSTGSKEFTIIHSSILSRKAEVSHV
jgi:GH15 family glucan-1,4-alpha-glucosidase